MGTAYKNMYRYLGYSFIYLLGNVYSFSILAYTLNVNNYFRIYAKFVYVV